MSHPLGALAAVVVVLLAGGGPAAAATSPAFDSRSTTAAPCGVGTPPAGHDSPELRPARNGIALTVRQDHDRLCYVAGGIADAPVIRVRQGADLTITLKNEIVDPAAIDAVTAAGKLEAPNEPVPRSPGHYEVIPGMAHAATGATNLHVHGFSVPPVAPQDDVLTVCADPAVGPAACGRRSFTYRYRIPADMPQGLYWYHPHVHGEVQAQMLMGLTGAIVVEGPEDDARRAARIGERVLIVRQTQDLDAGKTSAASMTAASPAIRGATSAPGHEPTPNAVDTAHELLCSSNSGIDQLSLNGTPVPLGEAPDDALARLEIATGARQLWRILNAATDAFLDLAIVDQTGRPLAIEIVARDGSPLTNDAGSRLHTPATTESQSVPPGGRIEFLVDAPAPGAKAYLVTHAVDTGCAGDRLPERRLAMVVAAPAQGAAATPATPARSPNHTYLSSQARSDTYTGLVSRKTDRERVIAMAEYPRPGGDDRTDFYIFERKPGAVLRPYMMGDAPAITVKAGTTEEWVVENWTHELHAFHIHQLHFRLLEIDGGRAADPALLDVAVVPYATATGYHSKEGPIRPGRIRIKMTFPEALAGDIPFHCHLVDHEDNGMMAVLRIVPAKHGQPARRRSQPAGPEPVAMDSGPSMDESALARAGLWAPICRAPAPVRDFSIHP